jgi:type II secretory pathway component PulF
MGEFSTTWRGPLITLVGITYGASAIWALPRWKGQGRAFCDRYVFPFSTYRDVTGFAWLLSYGALVKAGVPDVKALQGQIATASPWLASRLRAIEAGLTNGFDLAASMRLAGHGFPSMALIDDLGAYVGFPNFPEMIEVVAKQHADKLERTLISRSVIIGLLFSGLMFMAMLVLQLGANSISTLITINAGH